AEAVVHDHHFALCDQGAVDEHVQRLAGTALELDHRTLVELQQVADRDARAPDFQRQRHRHVEDHVQVEVGAEAGAGAGLGGERVEGGQRRCVVGGHGVVLRESRVGTARAACTCVTLMAFLPLWMPNSPVNSGICSTCSCTSRASSIGITSPTRSRDSSRRLIWRLAIAELSSTSASCNWVRIARDQPSSFSMRSLCTPASSCSRIGSSIAYGIDTCSSPPPPSSSTLKRLTTM